MSTKTPKMNRKTAIAMLGIAATMAYATPNMLSLGQAHASGGGSGGGGGFLGFGGGGGGEPRGFGSGSGSFRINDQITVTECSDCHQPYGGDALPQGAWRRMMGDLSNHFGEDASLDEQTRRHIENYLVSNAPAGDGPLRITEQPWFASEHRGEARLRQGQSWAECASCHGRQQGWNPKR